MIDCKHFLYVFAIGQMHKCRICEIETLIGISIEYG